MEVLTATVSQAHINWTRNPNKQIIKFQIRKIKPPISVVVSKSNVSTAQITQLESSICEKPLRVPDISFPSMSPDSLQYPAGFLGTIPEASREGEKMADAMLYLTSILSSKVYDMAIESPLQFAPKLSGKVGVNVWLKREDMQPAGQLLPLKMYDNHTSTEFLNHCRALYYNQSADGCQLIRYLIATLRSTLSAGGS